MSNYTQTTFFTPKDSLPAGNPGKVIFGAAYDVEFAAISTAIASKPDSTSNASFLNVKVTGAALPSGPGIYAPSSTSLGFSVNAGTAAGSISNTGAWTIPAPSAGVTLTLNAFASGTDALDVLGSASITPVVTIGSQGASGASGVTLQVFGTSTTIPSLLTIQNTTAGNGNGAYALLDLGNGTHFLTAGISSTGLVGGWNGTTGGPSGESARIATTGPVPIWFGVNLTEVMRLTTAGITIDTPASSGSALTINAFATGVVGVAIQGISSADAHSELSIQRAGSTANTTGTGPSVQFFDSTNSTQTVLQHSGGQTECWQFNGGSFTQSWFVDTSHNFNVPHGALKASGSLGINGSTVPAQPTGYGTPTGNALTASFAAGSITLANLAAEVAQLVIDLKKYGIIGA